MNDNDSTRRSAERSATPGMIAESLAARFLERHGLTILARNYRCRAGEVDIICREKRVLVFVEVRLRRSPGYGGAAASITATKKRRIILAAQHFLALHARNTEPECRFDCLLLDALSETAIEWLRDAFAAA